MGFVTKASYKPPAPYSPGGESLVELAGFRSTKEMVDELRLAGQRLEINRGFQYEWPGDSPPDDLPINPVFANRNFDVIDAQYALDEVNARLRSRIRELELQSRSAPTDAKSVQRAKRSEAVETDASASAGATGSGA